jgi:hypothetical protein
MHARRISISVPLFLTLVDATGLLHALRPAHAQTVDVTITADNSYSFGYGTSAGLSSLHGWVHNCTTGEIVNCSGGPETYAGVSAPAGHYVYIIAYSDGAFTQGTLGQFVGSTSTVLTGSPDWQVFATGLLSRTFCPVGPPSPTLAEINTQIGLANSNSGGPNSSVGWVGPSGGAPGTIGALAIGEDNSSNSPGGLFPIACNIASTAKWMWYTPDPATIPDPFREGTSDEYEFLIFRQNDSVTPNSSSTWGRIKTFYR